MATNIDPWDVDSPENIIEFNSELFFSLFPEVSKDAKNQLSVKELLGDLVSEALSSTITSSADSDSGDSVSKKRKAPHEMPDEVFKKHARIFFDRFPEVPTELDKLDTLEEFVRSIWHESQFYRWARESKKLHIPGRDLPVRKED